MKWNKYTIETTTAAEDYMSAMLADLGIEGVEIEDNIPLSKEDQADMFIDFLPELPPDDGVSHVSFYLEDNGEDYTELLKQVKIALEDLRKIVDVGSGVITSDQTEEPISNVIEGIFFLCTTYSRKFPILGLPVLYPAEEPYRVNATARRYIAAVTFLTFPRFEQPPNAIEPIA